MAVEITVTEAGELSMTFTGQSTAATLALAREVVPDIDERYAALVASFQPDRGADSGLPEDAAGYNGDSGRPEGPPEPEGTAGAEGHGSGEPEGVLDPGDRVEEGQQEGVPAEDQQEVAPECVICSGPVTPDFAGLMLGKHGEVLCPTHGTW